MLFGLLLPVVRTFISLPAGLAGMDAARFGLYTTIGCIPWTAALAGAGYAVGARWQSVASGFRTPTYIIAAVVVAAVAVADLAVPGCGRARSAGSARNERAEPVRASVTSSVCGRRPHGPPFP